MIGHGLSCPGKPNLDRDIVPAPALAHRIQRLVNIADKVDGKLERLTLPVVGRCAPQFRLQALQLGDDAVAFLRRVVVLRGAVSILRQVQVTAVANSTPRRSPPLKPPCFSISLSGVTWAEIDKALRPSSHDIKVKWSVTGSVPPV